MSAGPLALPPVVTGPAAVAVQDRRAIRGIEALRISTPVAIGLAILSGITFAAGFPPWSWPIAPWLALVPLLVACAVLSPMRAALAGTCWAMAVAAVVARFLPGMLSGYFGLGPVTSWVATVVVVGGLHGVYVSAYAAWVSWLVRRGRAQPVLLAGGWLVCEFARAHDGLSSPWAMAAYSQLGWTRVIQIADLAGPYGIGMLIAGVNACVAAWLMPELRGRHPWRSTAAIAAAVAATCLYGQWRLGRPVGDGDAVRVVVVQGGPPAAEKAQRPARLARHLELTALAADPRADLIVWPEHALDDYLEEPSSTHDAVLALSESAGADLIVGGPHYEPSSGGTRYHNSAYLVHAGRMGDRYDKHRLVPFAEDGRLGWLLGDKATRYEPGSGSFVLRASAVRLGMLLCVEAMFPDFARLAVRQGAEVLVNLSNDGWFGHPDPARQQLAIATLRAVEVRRYVVRAASTGFSAVIDPYGRAVAESGFGTEEVLNATVRASHARTPYERWGDAFAWVVIVAVAAASLRPYVSTARNTRRRHE